jgi:hypothetical protein
MVVTWWFGDWLLSVGWCWLAMWQPAGKQPEVVMLLIPQENLTQALLLMYDCMEELQQYAAVCTLYEELLLCCCCPTP